MPRDKPTYVQVHSYNRVNSLPTYEEATRNVSQRTHNEIALDIPDFSAHQCPINNSNTGANQNLNNSISVHHVSHAPLRSYTRQQHIRRPERNSKNDDLPILIIIVVVMSCILLVCIFSIAQR